MQQKKGKIREKAVERKKRKKNFFPTLILTIFLWTATGAIIYFFNPHSAGTVPLFFAIIFFAFLFTFSVLFANTRRGLITALGLTLFLLLKMYGIGNLLNFLLIIGVGISTDLILSKKNA